MQGRDANEANQTSLFMGTTSGLQVPPKPSFGKRLLRLTPVGFGQVPKIAADMGDCAVEVIIIMRLALPMNLHMAQSPKVYLFAILAIIRRVLDPIISLVPHHLAMFATWT
jgi:hypothetical protein